MIIIIAKIGRCSLYYDHSRCVNTMPDMLRMWPNSWLGELMLLFRRYVNSKQMLSVACFYRAKYKLNCYQFGRMCLMPCAASSKNEDKNGNWLTQFALQRSLGINLFLWSFGKILEEAWFGIGRGIIQGVFFNWSYPKNHKYGKKLKYPNWDPPKIS